MAGVASFLADSSPRSPGKAADSMIALSMMMVPAAAILSSIARRPCGAMRSDVPFVAANDAIMLARLCYERPIRSQAAHCAASGPLVGADLNPDLDATSTAPDYLASFGALDFG